MQAVQALHEREEQGPENREGASLFAYEVRPAAPPCTDKDRYGSATEHASEMGVGKKSNLKMVREPSMH